MRATEFLHWLNRTDIGIAQNPHERDYTHMTCTMKVKRARYQYQKSLRGEKVL
tara:strand:+ start:372 stop:530 length:159 start_codon:yes stop_codon:yes gene_type:complete